MAYTVKEIESKAQQLAESAKGLNQASLFKVQAMAMRDALDVVQKRMRDYIDERLADALFWRGPYADGTEYTKNALVQHGGTVYVCLQDSTTDRPGQSDAWRQLVKHAGRE